MAQFSCNLRPVFLVVLAVVLAAHMLTLSSPRHRLWWCICLWVCMVNRSGSLRELNITKSPFLATPTEDMNDYIY